MPTIRGYILPIAIRQTGATAANAVVWAMLNPSNSLRRLYLRSLILNAFFDGVAAASQSQYQLVRFRSTTPAGGTALVPQKKIPSDQTIGAPTKVTASFLDTGLTVAGIVTDGPMAVTGAPRANAASTQLPLIYPGYDATGYPIRGPIEVEPGDGLALMLGVAAVIGDGVNGLLEWDEVGGPLG